MHGILQMNIGCGAVYLEVKPLEVDWLILHRFSKQGARLHGATAACMCLYTPSCLQPKREINTTNMCSLVNNSNTFQESVANGMCSRHVHSMLGR